MTLRKGSLSFLAAALFAGTLPAQAQFTVQSGLLDQTNTETLGASPAAGTETFSIFKPTASTNHYSNGAVLIGFKGYLYCQWQTSPTNEDSEDTCVVYSRSQDGATWSAPVVLAPDPVPTGTNSFEYRSSGGWWVNGDTLVAYLNHWSVASPKGGYTEYMTSTDGVNWSAIQKVKMLNGSDLTGIFEQDPHALPGGRIINAAHFQPGTLCSPIYTDDPSGVSGWVKPAFTNSPAGIEPSWFYRSDGSVLMAFRNSSNLKLASVSNDAGQTWTSVAATTVPDSNAKQSAGNLPDATVYLVSNPVNDKRRCPLVLLRSRNGLVFDKAYLLRRGGSDLPTIQYTGTAKTLGYSYPKSAIWNGYLYSSYSVNKEEVCCTRVPLTSLQTVALADPATIQAEAATSSGGGVTMSTANAGYNSTGYADFPATGSRFLEFTNLNGGSGGSCILTIRFANGSASPRTGNLVVNGVTQPITFVVTTGPGTTPFVTTPPSTIVAAPASWTAWTSVDVPVTLAAGTGNTIRFESTGQDLANIDEIAVTPAAAATVTIAATDAVAGESGSDHTLQFTVSRTSPTINTLAVPLAATGNATAGSDYTGLPGSVLIPVGQTSATVTLTVQPDQLSEGTEGVTLTIGQSAGLALGSPASASATISDAPAQAYYFSHIADATKRGATDDADGDLLPNVVEYFIGSDPGASAGSAVLTPLPDDGSGTFKFHYPRAKNRPEVSATPQWSPDLQHWYASGVSDGVHTVTFAQAVVSAPNADPETVEATATITGPGTIASLYVRLLVQ